MVGLGPGDLDRAGPDARRLLDDRARTVVVRTLRHPAAEQLAALRPVVSCDDLYEQSDRFEDVYRAIAARVVDLAGDVVYAVPGSPLVGEFAVDELRRLSSEREVALHVHPAESFLDAVLAEVGVDPLRDGLQVLDAHHLPTPLVVDKPTVLAHLDMPEVLAEALARLGRVVAEGTEVVVLRDLGSPDATVTSFPVDEVDPGVAGPRTSLFLAPSPGGLVGAVQTMYRLREECPWDREQTHHSLVKNLIEETHELAEALAALPEEGEPDWVAYADAEDELGDVLLQVLFHSAIARQAGAFDADDVAENLRQKLVRRHPHVFGDVEADTPEQVKRNWDRIKRAERGGEAPSSALDGIPAGLPALARAAKLQRRAAEVGFDWPEAGPVLDKVREELAELASALDDREAAVHELGDLLFSIVNLARHLDLDPEVALRRSGERFARRFRIMEGEGPLDGLSLAELDERWERAKRDDPGPGR